ncbi:MAG: DHA2 family efflux MFS transporter permease subunit [Rhodospirillales bacterium]|nr:DHA2 family efflux MFS transporter permease subunit [Rhodospirillales bacterium]
MGPARPATPGERRLISICIMLATVMQVLDTTIANVALPHMQGSMSATQDQIAWVLTSYIIATAIMTPPTGAIAARFGRKRTYFWIVAGFTVTSMLCGIATSLPEMVLYRILQGAFGAGLVPLSQALLLDTYPRELHGKAMALWGLGVMIGPILGPTLGGYLTENWSWHWVFFINLPVGILAMIGILALVPETPRDRSRPFDAFGFVLLSLALGLIQLMLDRGQSQDWFDSTEIIVTAVGGGLCLYLFIVHTFTAKHPFIDPSLFTDRNFSTGLIFIFLTGVVLIATIALLPPYLQHLMNYPVLTTGLVLAPRGFGTLLAVMIVGRVIGKADVRILVFIGMSLTALSLWEMAEFTTEVDPWTIVRTGVIQGMGLGFIFVPLSTVSFSTLDPRRRVEGAGMFSLMRNLGSSLGVSVVMSLLARNIQINHASITETVTPFIGTQAGRPLPPLWDPATLAGLHALNDEITRQAAAIAYVNDFVLMMWMTILAIPLIALLRPPPRHVPGGGD